MWLFLTKDRRWPGSCCKDSDSVGRPGLLNELCLCTVYFKAAQSRAGHVWI